MPTRLYFRLLPASGELPPVKNTATVANRTASTVIRTMSESIGAAQASTSIATLATTTVQRALMGTFVSPELLSPQIVGGGSMTLNVAESFSNQNSNFFVNSVHIYVFRPSTGNKVGTIRDGSASVLGGVKPTSANSQQTTIVNPITSSAVSAQAGDVIVCEVWAIYTQGMATSYTGNFFYNGNQVSSVENASVSNYGSYIELSENISFWVPRPLSYGFINGA
jgi:hypothetical protein